MDYKIVDTDKLEQERAKEIRRRNIEEIVGGIVIAALMVAFCYICAIA